MPLLSACRPIFQRETLGLLRSWKAAAIAALAVAVTGTVPLLAWPSEGSPLASGQAARAAAAYVGTMAAVLTIFVPVIAAGTIAGERERGTYILVAATAIPPGAIVLGKLLASAGFFLLVQVLSFPAFAVLLLLGGATIAGYLQGLALLGAYTIFLALVGIWASSRCRKTGTAIYSAFGMLLGLATLAGIANILAPIVLLACTVALSRLAASNAALADAPHEDSPVPPIPPVESPDREPPEAPRYRPAGTVIPDLFLRRCARGIPDRWSPAFIAALRSEASGYSGLRLLLFLGTGFLLFLDLVAGTHGPAPATAAIDRAWLLVIAIAAAVLPGLGALSIAGERDGERLDLLRGTLLGAGEILRGKLLAVLSAGIAQAVLGLVLSLILLPMTLREPREVIPGIAAAAALAAAGTLLAAAAGFLAGVLVPRTGAALGAAYLTAAASIGAPLAMAGGIPRSASATLALAGAWTVLAAAALIAAGGALGRRWMRD